MREKDESRPVVLTAKVDTGAPTAPVKFTSPIQPVRSDGPACELFQGGLGI